MQKKLNEDEKRECVYETHPPSDLAELLCYKLVGGSPFATDGRNDSAFFFVRARTHLLFQMVVAGTFFDRVIKLLYCVSETGSSHSFVASGCSWV